LTVDSAGPVAYRACTSTPGCMCTESPCSRALAGSPHRTARVEVAPRPHERQCRAEGCGRGGSDHPSGCLVRHGDGWDVHAIPPHAWGTPARGAWIATRHVRLGRVLVRLARVPQYCSQPGTHRVLVAGGVGSQPVDLSLSEMPTTGRAGACSETRPRGRWRCRPAPRPRAPRHRGTPKIRVHVPCVSR